VAKGWGRPPAALIGILILVAVVVLASVFLPPFVERKLEEGAVEWLPVPPPPDSGFTHCWVLVVPGASDDTSRLGVVCR